MKKLLFICLIFVCFINIKVHSSVLDESSQGKNLYAYVFYNNSWRKGILTIEVRGNVEVITSCEFQSIPNLKVDYYDGKRLIPLNPNNQMAVSNNFTHFFTISGLNIYVTNYQ